MTSRATLSTPLLLVTVFLLCAILPGALTEHGRAQDPVGGAAPAARSEPVTVIFVRHAEKGTDDPRDPGLSEAGTKRAAELARVLGHAGVTHLFSSEYRRTKDTLQPLAEVTGVDVVEVSARKGSAQIEALRALPPGSVAIVAGHSNTTPGLAETLSGARLELEQTSRGRMFGEKEYDRMVVVTLAGVAEVAPQVLDLRYGAQ